MTCAIHGASLQDITTADQFLLQTDNSTRIPHAALTSPTLKPMCRHVSPTTAKGKLMGVSIATARNLFVCLSFLLVSTVPLRPALAQTQKPTVSYDEKKRQANDIAVTVVVSGIS